MGLEVIPRLDNHTMSRLLFRYILGELAPSFFISLLIFSLVLFMEKIMQIVEWIVQKGVPVSDVFKMLGCLLPNFFVLTLPSALLLSVLLTFGRLYADNELYALRASGISLYKLLPPVYIFGLVVLLVSLVFTTFVGPRSTRAFQSMFFSVASKNFFVGFKERIFFDDFPGFVGYVEHIDHQQKKLQGVFMAQLNYPEKPMCYFAKEGQLSVDSEGGNVILELLDGTIHRNVASKQFYQLAHFERLLVKLNLKEMLLPAQSRKYKTEEFTSHELRVLFDEWEQRGVDYRKILFYYHRRIALPFATLIFCTIGVPLALLSQRAVRYTGFSLSIGVVLLYYILMQAGAGLVQAEYLPPLIGAWLSNLVLGPLGLYLLWKKAEEKPITILDGTIQRFQKMVQRISKK